MNVLAAGSLFNFRPQPGVPFDEVWRPLDHSVVRWVMSHGGSALLAEVAGWASYAEGQGDSALPLRPTESGRHGMRILDTGELSALAREPMVTWIDDAAVDEAGISQPFAVQFDHFYLRRNCMHEIAVARHIQHRRSVIVPSARTVSDDELDILFDGQRGVEVQPQRNAVRRVMGRRLFVLTGGPGTGKTTTVLRMLMALGRGHTEAGNAAPVIRIGAPTGKAAQRLTDALRLGSMTMREGRLQLPSEWLLPLDNALAAESGTLHRLLGSRGRHGGFTYHAGNRLPADIVVVDEASMVDLVMLRALLEALRDDAVLLLVGDADQLTSVGTGSVLLDLVSAMEADSGQDLVRLHHSFRADKSLVPINAAIQEGRLDAFHAAWRSAGDHAVHLEVAGKDALARRLQTWCQDVHSVLGAAGAFDAIRDGDSGAIRNALHALKRQQLLCARREGEFGAEQVNDAIEANLRKRIMGSFDEVWYPGRAVMVTRNDYAYDLYNGDVGICLRDENGNMKVWFESGSGKASDGSEAAGSPGLRCLATGSLPVHQSAFATTVHKSQGSEYERVAVLLPPDKDNAVLSRQLLYTALTRAKTRIELWGAEDVLEAALSKPIERSAVLRRRIQFHKKSPC